MPRVLIRQVMVVVAVPQRSRAEVRTLTQRFWFLSTVLYRCRYMRGQHHPQYLMHSCPGLITQ